MTHDSSLPQSPTPGFDEDDLKALEEAIGQVLSSEADRLSLHRHIDGEVRLDQILWASAVELGWPAIGLPEDAGGLGFGTRGLDLLHRQLGRVVAPGPFLATLSAAQTISDTGTSKLKAEWLPRLATGECKLAVVAQPGKASTTDETWVLGDEDCEVALAPVGDDWALVRLPPGGAEAMWDRTRAMSKRDLSQAEAIARLPGKAAGPTLTRHLSLGVASDSIGGARAITERTIAYMKERQQFDRPIASFQALKHRIADLMTLIVSGEEVVALAVEAVANGRPDADIWAKLAKARCTRTYSHVATECLQLHGGVGFTKEFDVHLYLNRARLGEMLVAPNPTLQDEAAAALADAVRNGGQPLELAS